MEDDNDERQEEMDCIAAIFPETIFDPSDPFTATIEIPVNPQTPVKVVFPASSDGTIATGLINTPPPEQDDVNNIPILESHDLSHLPSLRLRISLPDGYPSAKAPHFELSTSPAWLSRKKLDELEASGEQMWEEAGRSLVVYGFIDSLQQAAENAFGFTESGMVLEASPELKISLLDYDIKARQQAFEKETFDCGVCLGMLCLSHSCWSVMLTVCNRSKERHSMSQDDRMRTCLLPSMPSRFLQQRNQRRRFSISKMSRSLVREAASFFLKSQTTTDTTWSVRTPTNPS